MKTTLSRAILMFLLIPIPSFHGNRQSTDSKRCSRVFLTISSLWRPQGYSGRMGAEMELELNWETDCNEEYINSVALFKEYPGNKGAVPLVQVSTKQYPGYFRTNYTLGDTPLPGGWQSDDIEDVNAQQQSKGKSEEHFEPSSEQMEETEDDEESGLEVRKAGESGGAHAQEPLRGDHCFPFWIAAFLNTKIVFTDCLKIRPTWIWDHRSELGDMSLRSLLIPGTHNSGCYRKVSSASSRRNTFSSRFLLTQDVDIYTQLVHGIRYLDIRVGYYPSTPELFWVNHDVARLLPLHLVLQGVKQFLRKSPDPVLLDLHRFPVGFSDRKRGRRKQLKRTSPAHQLLVDLLWKELGEFSPADGSVPINALWKSGRRLLVSYANEAAREKFPWLRGVVNSSNDKISTRSWTKAPSVTVTQEWGNVQNSSQLFDFLSHTIDKRKKSWGWSGNGEPWAAMAELTPTPMDIVFSYPGTGLRQMAHDVNRNISRWFRDLWWQDANIVATDFFRGTNLIDVAVESNLRRSHI